MASCQTYASSSHIRHPWFDTTVMKRKHRETVSPEEDAHFSSKALPPPKRLRFTNLENGFAHMSLGSNSFPSSASSASVEPSYPQVHEVSVPVQNMDMDMSTPTPITHPDSTSTYETSYTVEEPKAPEVAMKTSSWYEPEPNRRFLFPLIRTAGAHSTRNTGIIITDMDSFTQSDDDEDDGIVSVNPALLDRMRKRALQSSTSTPRIPVPPSTSQALVLFQPLPLMNGDLEVAKARDERQKQAATASKEEPVTDEDAMDVEP
ncbi:hypothetical protein D9613_000609 [Agrocybe pediades]|uniref:Uncharacterized protein n=1 Tax=Agrocybe pediades TaxID=84607 RepID=A0A8H4R0B4_9AGAR|nr:hypothetical protein D9613_000609 [Agrocybe pediades]